METITAEECIEEWSSYSPENEICATGKTENGNFISTCKGDSGGKLQRRFVTCNILIFFIEF